jgi:hypothetical protein
VILRIAAWCSDRLCLVVFALLLVPFAAYPQTTLTGAYVPSTDSTGTVPTAPGQSNWNTVPVSGDCCYGLWLALNPDATSPVNGPSNAQLPISIPLVAGNSYTYYMFGYPYMTFSYNGLNLFFDGEETTPGISVFGALNSPSFRPDSGTTNSLQNSRVPGSGSSAYSADGVVVVLTAFEYHTSATPPGNVCQGYTFAPAPENVADYYGSFTLQVFQAASLGLSQTSGSPGSKLTVTGSGFAPSEAIEIYLGTFGAPPVVNATSDPSGGFKVSALEPQDPYGALNIFALGLGSQKLGAAKLSVTPGMVATPESVAPGATTTAQGAGFGSGELVSVYLDEPRQLLGTTTSNALGSFTGNSGLTVTIPSNAALGTNALIGIGQTTEAIGLGKITVR